MQTPEWLKWAFGDSMDVKEMLLLAAAIIIILGAIF